MYWLSGRVTLSEIEREGVCAVVRGSSAAPYDVALHWEKSYPGMIAVVCDCPLFRSGEPCKHIWATVLAADALDVGRRVPGGGQLKVVRAAVPESSPAREVRVSTPVRGTEVRHQPTARSPDPGIPPARRHDPATVTERAANRSAESSAAPSAWQRQLRQLSHGMQRREFPAEPWLKAQHSVPDDGRQLLFLINREVSAQTDRLILELGWRGSQGASGILDVSFLDAQDVMSLPMGELRQLVWPIFGVAAERETRRLYSIPTYRGWNPEQEHYAEQHSDWQGEDVDSSPPDHRAFRGELSSDLIELLLPRLCATGHCRVLNWLEEDLGEPLTWDAGEPWEARIRLAPSLQNGHLRLTGELVRGDECLPADQLQLLISRGWYIGGGKCGRVRPSRQVSWLIELESHGELRIPASELSGFLTAFYDSPAACAIELPANGRWKNADVAPVPRLHLERQYVPGMTRAWKLEPHFLYGSLSVQPHATTTQLVCPVEQCIFPRRLADETQRLAELQAAPKVRMRATYTPRGREEVAFVADTQLENTLDHLVQREWQVVMEGQPLRKGGALSLSVQSTVDWFELDGKLDYGNAAVGLPALLTALREGKNLVRLDDGSCALIPREVRERFGRLASLADAGAEGVKFRPSQALLLDALLAAEAPDRVRRDKRFEEARQRLQSFRGIEARKPPTGFQGELRHYQEEGLGWLHFLREFGWGGCLADDMGLGKTIQILALLEERRRRSVPRGRTRQPSLIVVPKSLVFNWMAEAARFTPELRVVNYTGLERRTRATELEQADVVLTTYGTLRQDVQELQQRTFDYVILDEAQAIKNAQSQASKACRLLRSEHRLALTGTPVENHLGELWSLFEFLNPGLLGQSARFQSLVRATTPRAAISPRAESAESPAVAEPPDGGTENADVRRLLAQSLRPFILRRTKQQVLTELPERTEQTLFCEMEKKQRALYTELRDYYRQSLTQRVARTGMAKAKIHVLEALLRLRQAACHPALLDPKYAGTASAKMEALREQLNELIAEGHKALVFSQFTSLLALVRQDLDAQQVRYEYLDGQTSDRQACVNRFQADPDIPLFLISLRAGGQGLNLTAADYVFILDPWWNPAVEAQAIDRAYRLGQTRHVFAYRLICRDTVEEKILELQRSKRELADAIITEDNSVLRNLTVQDLELLLG